MTALIAILLLLFTPGAMLAIHLLRREGKIVVATGNVRRFAGLACGLPDGQEYT